MTESLNPTTADDVTPTDEPQQDVAALMQAQVKALAKIQGALDRAIKRIYPDITESLRVALVVNICLCLEEEGIKMYVGDEL